MKKILTLFFLFGVSFVSAFAVGNLKVKVSGDGFYNQIRVVNKTDKNNFECKVYQLKKDKDDKFIVNKEIGVFHLEEERGNVDSLMIYTKKNQYLGVVLPDGFEEVKCKVFYPEVKPFVPRTVELVLYYGDLEGIEEEYFKGQEF